MLLTEEVEAIFCFLLIGFGYDARSNVNATRRDATSLKRRDVAYILTLACYLQR